LNFKKEIVKMFYNLQAASSGQKAAANRRFGVMAAGRTTFGFSFAVVLQFRQNVGYLAFSFYHGLFIINLASAAGGRNAIAATTPSLNR